jgi:ribonuclease HII
MQRVERHEEEEERPMETSEPPPPKKRERKPKIPLAPYYDPAAVEAGGIEIGVDEAGRGPLFGRLYVAAVVLPKDVSVVEEWRRREIRDSKKYTSKTKITEVSKYIRETAFDFEVQLIEATEIDAINIRQAVLLAMHRCVSAIRSRTQNARTLIVVDGCDFTPHMEWCEELGAMREVPSVTVEGGDNAYLSIAAASILAKVARDEYIAALCVEHPYLAEWYGLDTNMGYGTRVHMEGIRQYGITEWHRKSYGPCRV